MSRGLRVLLLSGALFRAAAQDYTISLLAGGSPPPLTVPALGASLATPAGVAVDTSGNVYFTSTNCVFKLDKSGAVTRIAGTSGFGYAGDGGPATQARLSLSPGIDFPTGLAVDGAGNVYLADVLNSVIRKVSLNGIITTVAGNGKPGFSGDGGNALNAELYEPYGVAVDGAGNLYIADYGDSTGGRLRVVNPAGIISTIAGNGVFGTGGIGGPAVNASLQDTMAVAVDASGNIYVVEETGRVLKISTSRIITLVVTIQSPFGIAADSSGNIYVASAIGNDVIKVTPAAAVIRVAGNGIAGYSGDNGSALAAELNGPPGVAIDPSGNLYIADYGNNRIRKVTPQGVITTIAGNGTQSGDNGPALAAQLAGPTGVALDAFGNIYIADYSNCRVRKVSTSGIITTVAGNGVCDAIFTGEGALATATSLSTVYGIAVDAVGNLYLCDLYTVRKVSTTGIITTYAGTTLSQGYSGIGGPATKAILSQPYGLALDKLGNLYIADVINSVVLKVSSGIISAVAGNGKMGFSGDGGPAISAELNSPEAVAIDNSGNLYISDGNNFRVRKVSPSGIITTVTGNGNEGYAPILGGPATAAQPDSTDGVAVDSAGNLFIVDGWAGRILRIAATNGQIADVAGSDKGGWGNRGQTTDSYLVFPMGIAIDPSGNLYVTDINDNVVRLLKPIPLSLTTASPLPPATVGVAYNQSLSAAGGIPPYNWSVASGTLPAAMSLSPAGTLSGTPTASAAATFTLEVIDSTPEFTTKGYTLTVNTPLAITTTSSPSGQMGVSYSLTFTASGGAPPYSWSLASGALPPGLTLAATGAITGTPSAGGAFNFMVKVSDSASGSATHTMTLTISYPNGYTAAPSIAQNGVVSAGGFQTAIRSGSWASIYGTNLSATSRNWTPQDFNGSAFPTSLDGVSISINGLAAYVESISPAQINFQVPAGIAPGNAQMIVTNAAGASAVATATVANYAPAFFIAATLNARNYVAATETTSTGTLYIGPSAANGLTPAMAGDNLTLWGTGFGPTQPDVPAGALFSGAAPLIDAVQIFIDNIPVTPQFAGISAAGLYQFNIVVPNLSPGDHQVFATVAGVSTANQYWLATQ